MRMRTYYKGIKINGKKIDEHRYVWEQANGPIPPKMVIHHKNHNKRDNRIENLELMTYQVHNKEHKSYENWFKDKDKWLKRHLEIAKEKSKDKDGLFWCNLCRTLLPKESFSKNKKRLSGIQNRCVSCRSKSRRKK
jgi:hypothetical protein